jgi:cobalt-zinc-cadmium efflux system outer membrane protein
MKIRIISLALSTALFLPCPSVAQSGPTAGSAAQYVSGSGMTLNQLVDAALVRNADLLAVRQRGAEMQALYRQAGLRPNPSVELSVTNGAILNSVGESEISVGYAHTLELGGKRERRLGVSQSGIDLARTEIAERERQLKAEVKLRFADAQAAVQNLRAAELLSDLIAQSFRIAQARTAQGEGTPLEEGLLRVEVNRIESDRLLFANQVERASLQLKTLAGMDVSEPLQLAGGLVPPQIITPWQAVLDRAIAERNDLRAARIQEQLGEAELRLARSAAVPDLVVSGRYSRVSSRFDQLGFARIGGPLTPLRDTDNLLTGGISISLPVRDQNQGNIQAAIARRDAAALRGRYVEALIRQEVRAALSRYEAARSALRLLDEGVVRQSQENLRVLRAAYGLGEIRLAEVITEQRRLIDTQRAYTDLLKEAFTAAVELERSVGASIF